MANPLSHKRSRAVTSLVETTVLAELPSLLATASFLVNGVKMTATQVEAVLTGHLTAIGTVNTTSVAYHAAVAAEQALEVQARAVIAAVEVVARATFGVNSPEYALLGFTSKKRVEPTVETKVEAVAKAKATRAARNTGGKKQKAKIHGTPATPETSKK
jgi:hypothetical protein